MSSASFTMLLWFLWCLLLLLVIPTTPISEDKINEPYRCYQETGNYTANSTYQTNLNTVLSTLISPTTEYGYGFYNLTFGKNPDQVYLIGLCRGDAKPDDCRICFNESIIILTQIHCPHQKAAIRWGGQVCILRYSNHPIFGVKDSSNPVIIYNTEDANDIVQFTKAVDKLMRNLTSRAASGDYRRKYATGNSTDFPFQIIRGLTQCTPDLSQDDCVSCLNDMISGIRYFYGKVGGIVYSATCIIRFEIYDFYGPTIELPPLSPSSSPQQAQAPTI